MTLTSFYRCPLTTIAALAAMSRSSSAFAQATTSLPANLPNAVDTRTLLILAVCLLAAQMGLIAALLVRRSRVRLMGDALRAVEARHVAMLRALPDMLFMLNRDGVYLDVYAPETSALYVPRDRFPRETRTRRDAAGSRGAIRAGVRAGLRVARAGRDRVCAGHEVRPLRVRGSHRPLRRRQDPVDCPRRDGA